MKPYNLAIIIIIISKAGKLWKLEKKNFQSIFQKTYTFYKK